MSGQGTLVKKGLTKPENGTQLRALLHLVYFRMTTGRFVRDVTMSEEEFQGPTTLTIDERLHTIPSTI